MWKNHFAKNDPEPRAPIKIAPNVRIGYFSQELSILEENKSILDNVMAKAFMRRVC